MMIPLVKKWALISAVLVAASSRSTVFAEVEIKLHERVSPVAPVVRLGDVAEISTPDRQQARQLAALPLMPAPAPGTARFIRAREIQDMLAAQGVDVAGLRFGGAEQISIQAGEAKDGSIGSAKPNAPANPTMNRHAAILAGAASDRPVRPLDDAQEKLVRERLNAFIANFLRVKTGKQWRVECDATHEQLAQLSSANTELVCGGSSDPWSGRQRFLLSFGTPEGQVKLQIGANVTSPPIPAVVAIRPIARGDVIRAADIELQTIDAPTKGSQRVSFDSVETLIGKEARQAIQAGDVVFADQVQSPILVKRGDLITVTSQSGGIRVRTTARALNDGAQGDLVRVESLPSREKYDAQVVGQREASVFGVSRPSAPVAKQNSLTQRR